MVMDRAKPGTASSTPLKHPISLFHRQTREAAFSCYLRIHKLGAVGDDPRFDFLILNLIA